MHKQIELQKEVLGYPITITAIPAGNDWNIVVLGGCAPHVGSVTLAEHKNNSIELHTLFRNSHKDHIVGEKFARVIAEEKNCTVCVSCGIHYDNATLAQISQIIAECETLSSELCSII